MGIYEKPTKSGIWHISYCDGTGLRHREKVGGRRDAELAYHKRKTEIREGRYIPPRAGGRGLTFRALAALAMEDKKPRVRRSSYNGGLGLLKMLDPLLGHIPVTAITPVMIQDVLAKLMQRRELGNGSGNRYRSIMSSVFNYGTRIGHTQFNPVSRVRCFKEAEGRVRCLTTEEEEKLRAVIRAKTPEREAEFDLALYTGMRRGEQFTLKWSGVNFENGLLEVHGKTGRRFINLNSTARAALEKLKECRAEGAIYVCPDTKHDEQRDHLRWFENAVTEAGVKDFRRHDLRHSFASRLANDGVSIYGVSKLLGHRSIAMSERYMHLSKEHLAREVEKIGRTEMT